MPSGRKINLVGNRYGRLTVVKRVDDDKNGNLRYLCKCECGKEKIILACNITLGRTVSCGCWNDEKRFQPFGVSNLNRVLRMYKFNAKNTGKDWVLSDEEFKELTQDNCYYCGSSPSTIQNDKRSNGAHVYNGIDRVDNNVGYVKSNCVTCCAKCNYMKGSYSKEEFVNQAKKVALKWHLV